MYADSLTTYIETYVHTQYTPGHTQKTHKDIRTCTYTPMQTHTFKTKIYTFIYSRIPRTLGTECVHSSEFSESSSQASYTCICTISIMKCKLLI